MIKIFSLVMAFLCSFYYSQQQIQVLDAETQKPIPYAKLILKDKDYYRNTEENGKITLEKDEEPLEVQSFGYEDFRTEKYQSVYLLKPKFTEIEEVEISKPKFKKSFKVGNLKSYGSFGGGFNSTKPGFWGKVITLNKVSNEPIFIKKISFKTIAAKENVVIRMLIYENVNGLPGEILRSEEIVCKAGRNKLQEFSLNPLTFPKEGIIVGFEWILNENNRYETTMRMKGSDEIKKVFAFSPEISGCEENEGNAITGTFFEGKWHFQPFVNSQGVKIKFNPAIQLELTN